MFTKKLRLLTLKDFSFVGTLIIVIAFSLTVSQAQESWGKLNDLVSYEGDPILDDIYSWMSDEEAEDAVNYILGYVGIPKNFEIQAANVNNAAAYFDELSRKRVIFYNQTWIKSIQDNSNTDWAATSILAHEIGHHLSGHSLTDTGSRPELELQADRFSGFVLANMGASLEDAQYAISNFVGNSASATHPPKSARLAAIANGWIDACQKIAQCDDRGSSSMGASVGTVISSNSQVITNNSQWNPEIKEIEGTRMVKVPAGSFRIGSEGGDSDEKNGNVITFEEPYWIDETEVSRGAYEECINAGECDRPSMRSSSTTSEQPINRVTWYDAAKYCEWRRGRLPTEAEWEYAARGPDGLVYPWGTEIDDSYALYGKSFSSGVTSSVGLYPKGMSWVGARNMAGNVWEWTSTIKRNYPYDHRDGRDIEYNSRDVSQPIVIRGGSFLSPASLLRAAYRNAGEPVVANYSIGFRCARSNSGF